MSQEKARELLKLERGIVRAERKLAYLREQRALLLAALGREE